MSALIALDVAVILVALADALTHRHLAIDVARHCPPVLSVGRSNPVQLVLTQGQGPPVSLAVRDEAAQDIDVEAMPAWVSTTPNAHTVVRYAYRPERRGERRLGRVWLRWPTRLGLWQQQRGDPLDQTIRVYPDLMALRARQSWLAPGRDATAARLQRKLGGQAEFERLREYNQDDDVRRIDWRATARRRALMVRQYQLERDQRIVFALEMGRWMTAESAGVPVFDRALNATLRLGQLAIQSGDQVGLLAFDDQVRAWLAPQGGAGAMRQLVRSAFDLHPSLVEPDYESSVATLRTRLPRRSLVVLFTQVHDAARRDELVRVIRALQPQHLPVVVSLRDESLEALAAVAPWAEGDALFVRGAAASHVLERERMVAEFRQAGAIVVHERADALDSALVQRYLDVKVRQLL
ncbi:MAG: DUF58 domain-containing protein [Deltaproteobacteria bacterium]|nr:DUF58 domain-containing protein [Deltaproteobacteria bacterium]